MPLNKQELAKAIEQENGKAIEALCVCIDAELKAKWNPSTSGYVTVSVDSCYSYATQRVVELYKQLGWDVTCKSDQRDGSWLTFK